MNIELAMMALEGLAQSPVSIRVTGSEVIIEGERASMKELARLLLLLGSDSSDPEDAFGLTSGLHVSEGSPNVTLRVRSGA